MPLYRRERAPRQRSRLRPVLPRLDQQSRRRTPPPPERAASLPPPPCQPPIASGTTSASHLSCASPDELLISRSGGRHLTADSSLVRPRPFLPSRDAVVPPVGSANAESVSRDGLRSPYRWQHYVARGQKVPRANQERVRRGVPPATT